MNIRSALCVCAFLLVSAFSLVAPAASAHVKVDARGDLLTSSIAVSIPDKCTHHLTAHPSHVRDGVIRAEFVTVTGCKLLRNDFYDIIASDTCIMVLTDDVANVVQADGEGRINFEVRLGGSNENTNDKLNCQPDAYILTLRDQAPNKHKERVVITVMAA